MGGESGDWKWSEVLRFEVSMFDDGWMDLADGKRIEN